MGRIEANSATFRFFVRPLLGIAFLFATGSAVAQVLTFADRGSFTNFAPTATLVINFENHSGNEGFLPDFNEIGFVTFHDTTNYNQEVIVGYNIGQPGNKVYTTVAA